MKKLISILVSVIMLTSTAFAADAEDISELFEKNAELKSAGGEMILKMQLNSPLEILDTIPDIPDAQTDINARMIIESLAEAQTKMNYKYSMSENYRKMTMDMSVEFSTPIRFNDSFGLDAWTKIGMWIDYDFTDESNPVYKIIYKVPFMKKYTVLDMSGYYRENPDLMFKLDADKIKDLNKKAMNIISENAEITKDKNEYTLRFSDESAKRYISEVFELSKEFLPDGEEMSEYEEMVSQINAFLANTNIFGKNGITITLTKNSDGYISAETVDMHIKINVYDILTSLSKSTSGLDRDKAFVDITVKSDATLPDHNKAKVVLPNLTEENSDVTDYRDNMAPAMFAADAKPPLFVNESVYYPIEDISLILGQELSVKTSENETTLVFGGGIPVEVKGNEIKYGEISIISEKAPAITENSILYCNEDVLGAMNIFVWNVYYDFDKKQIAYNVEYNPLTEKDDEYTEYEYNPPVFYYYICSDQLPYIENGKLYMPVFDLCREMFNGEVTFCENGFTYTADSDNEFGIKSISVYEGDDFITADGKKIPLYGKVININNILRVPASLAEQLGMRIDNVQIYNKETYYDLSMDNPNYVNNVEDTEINWFYDLF